VSVTCYPSPGKRKALKVCRAFAEGCGGTVAPTGQAELAPGPAFFHGWTEHSARLIARCRREGRAWFYGDNAYYMGRGRYFRVTRNALMHDGLGIGDEARLASLGVALAPWRRTGRHIVVATQSETFYRMHLGMGRDDWAERTRREIACHTQRPILVCHKPAPPWPGQLPHLNFEEVLSGAWAVVTYSSSVAVKALIEGVPVFALGPSMAAPMASNDLARIEAPPRPRGRWSWLAVLAANQWTREEMRRGRCWADLRAFADS